LSRPSTTSRRARFSADGQQAKVLRRIAVYVDVPEPGWFAWTPAEAAGDMSNWTQIEHADE
jgi:hypothetical protein